MTKRKMKCLILTGILVLFFCATLMNYWSADEYVEQDMNSFWSSTAANEFLHEYFEGKNCDTVELHRKLTYGYNPVYATFVKPAFAFAMIDKDKNVIFRSESGIWWTDFDNRSDGFSYVSIEEYMTPELKKEFIRFEKKADNRSLLPVSLELHFDGEKYHPVSITLDNQRNDVRKFTFTDLKVTETVYDKNHSIRFYLYDIKESGIDHTYYKTVNEELDKTIEEFRFDDFEGGGGTSGQGIIQWTSRYDDHAYFFLAKYNTFYEVITSDMFIILTQFMSVLFAVVTAIILGVASKLYDRQKSLEQSKRAFISAAAHELKTPLAVIQNQCECVIENINPEKNSEYVKSVYDEALRMNSIVMSLLTFNRISDLTEVKKEKCNLSQLVREEITKYENFAQSKGAEIKEEIEDDIFTDCNSELIAIAVDNYLSNAVKYATGEKNITVTLKKDSRGFIFCVYNDFDGEMPSADMWNIFTRADKARNSADNSTGMGLPVNKKIFELHNYRYSYRKTKDGIVFSFQN